MACFMHNMIGFSLFIGLIQVASSQRSDQKLRIVTVKDYPNLYQASDGSFYGFLPDLLDLLGLNYTLSLDEYYGYKDVNDSWNGMMGKLVEDEADVAGLLTVTDVRADDVDFVHPVQTVEPAIVMKKPVRDKPSLAERLSRLLEPLEFSVWLMSFLALLVTGTILYIIAHFNPYEWRRMYKDREATHREAESFTCLNSFWFVVSTLMWQGYVRAPRSVGARILVTSWWAFVVIFLLSYTASLTNYLHFGRDISAIKGFSKIRSFADLADNTDMRVGVLPKGATESSFKHSKMPVYKHLYRKILESRTNETNFQTTNEFIDYIREQSYSDYAVILESSMAKFVTHQDPCNLYMIKDDFNLRVHSFAVQKGSPLRQALSSGIMRLHQNGEIHALETKWYKQQCVSSVFQADQSQNIEFSAFYALDLGTFSAALLILVVGIILGGIVTVIEVCIYKFAETRSDEDESEPTNRETNEKLLGPEGKKGGATQV